MTKTKKAKKPRVVHYVAGKAIDITDSTTKESKRDAKPASKKTAEKPVD